MNVRLQALNTLLQVVQHNHSLDAALDKALKGQQVKKGAYDGAHSGLLKELCYGVLRWWPRLEAIEKRLLDKPLAAKHQDLRLLIWLGIYQLEYLRIADHAAISETVACAQAIKKQWAKGLINAILRRFQREREQILASLNTDLIATTAHPAGLLTQFQQAWPNNWQEIVVANNARAPMSLRVNQRLLTRDEYLSRLQQAGIAAVAVAHVEPAISLDDPCAVETLPGFAEGMVSVQDAAAQLAANLLAPQPGECIVDACAAPGGKTCHLLEHEPGIDLIAIDNKARRLQRLEENLQRLGFSCQQIVADASDTASWWDGRPVDRILLDAPCSGSGVIRRHPDIKWLRQSVDLRELIATQGQLLRALWQTLKPGGVLLYATCSILAEENQGQIARFLGETADAEEIPIKAAWGCPMQHGRTILPGEKGMDGFYYARLRKV
ncbi:MAG: 16S rRNA (cytosine(967)-C(5))-methyltransferase [Gammaproteobacteria bacterium]|nr:MAG: 16S rRNA (cytosine(967)-C(5))-methyltransferase [Gammaproteobacteria bacterium]